MSLMNPFPTKTLRRTAAHRSAVVAAAGGRRRHHETIATAGPHRLTVDGNSHARRLPTQQLPPHPEGHAELANDRAVACRVTATPRRGRCCDRRWWRRTLPTTTSRRTIREPAASIATPMATTRRRPPPPQREAATLTPRANQSPAGKTFPPNTTPKMHQRPLTRRRVLCVTQDRPNSGDRPQVG